MLWRIWKLIEGEIEVREQALEARKKILAAAAVALSPENCSPSGLASAAQAVLLAGARNTK